MEAPNYVKYQIPGWGIFGPSPISGSEKTGYETWVWGLGWVEVEMVGGVEGV